MAIDLNKIKELEEKLARTERELKEAELEEEFERILREYHGDDEVISFEEMKKLLEEKKDFWIAKTKIPTLDKLIEGFREGDLIVVTAPTSHGKTTFCQTLTNKFSDQGIKSLWFSYEVPVKEFLAKFGDDLPLGYLPKSLVSRALLWIERKIVEAIAKYQIKVVFIDHLHYLIDLARMRNPSLEIGSIVRKLKEIALKYELVIFIVAHMTKTKFDEKAGIEDIRDSSFISQEADYVICLQRIAEKQSKRDLIERGKIYTNQTLLSVEKNRRTGKLGSLKLILKDEFFEELTEDL